MAITVEFDGRLRKKFTNVSPGDIVLRERSIFVQGVRIPVSDDRLYDLFYLLEKKTKYKHGKIVISLLVNDDIRYLCNTSNDTMDFYASKILGFGTTSGDYCILARHIHEIPSFGDVLIGND